MEIGAVAVLDELEAVTRQLGQVGGSVGEHDDVLGERGLAPVPLILVGDMGLLVVLEAHKKRRRVARIVPCLDDLRGVRHVLAGVAPVLVVVDHERQAVESRSPRSPRAAALEVHPLALLCGELAVARLLAVPLRVGLVAVRVRMQLAVLVEVAGAECSAGHRAAFIRHWVVAEVDVRPITLCDRLLARRLALARSLRLVLNAGDLLLVHALEACLGDLEDGGGEGLYACVEQRVCRSFAEIGDPRLIGHRTVEGEGHLLRVSKHEEEQMLELRLAAGARKAWTEPPDCTGIAAFVVFVKDALDETVGHLGTAHLEELVMVDRADRGAAEQREARCVAAAEMLGERELVCLVMDGLERESGDIMGIAAAADLPRLLQGGRSAVALVGHGGAARDKVAGCHMRLGRSGLVCAIALGGFAASWLGVAAGFHRRRRRRRRRLWLGVGVGYHLDHMLRRLRALVLIAGHL